jgi:hypothetical protein
MINVRFLPRANRFTPGVFRGRVVHLVKAINNRGSFSGRLLGKLGAREDTLAPVLTGL